MEKLNQKIKLILYPVLFWIIFLIIPLEVIAPKTTIDGGWIILYLLIVPFIFFLPYKLIKLKNTKEKLFFIIFGFVLPFIIFYIYLFIEFIEGFSPSF